PDHARTNIRRRHRIRGPLVTHGRHGTRERHGIRRRAGIGGLLEPHGRPEPARWLVSPRCPVARGTAVTSLAPTRPGTARPGTAKASPSRPRREGSTAGPAGGHAGARTPAGGRTGAGGRMGPSAPAGARARPRRP